LGAEIGFVSTDRRLVDFLAQVFELDEDPPIEVDAEIMEQLPGSPSNSTVRTQLRVLEGKGLVRHQEQGLRYIYLPTVPRHSARRSALKHLVDTFFEGSNVKVVAALLGGETRITDEELERIAELVKSARSESR